MRQLLHQFVLGRGVRRSSSDISRYRPREAVVVAGDEFTVEHRVISSAPRALVWLVDDVHHGAQPDLCRALDHLAELHQPGSVRPSAVGRVSFLRHLC